MKRGWYFLVEHNEAVDFHLVVVVAAAKNLPVGCGAFLGYREKPNAATEGDVVSSRQANNENVTSK